MASITTISSPITVRSANNPSLKLPKCPPLPLFLSSSRCRNKNRKSSSLVTRGALPGTSTYIFAVVMPLSLVAITVFTSIRVADKLDRDFLQEMELNRAIMEANDDDGEIEMPVEKRPSTPRRNRPKREAETSTM